MLYKIKVMLKTTYSTESISLLRIVNESFTKIRRFSEKIKLAWTRKNINEIYKRYKFDENSSDISYFENIYKL